MKQWQQDKRWSDRFLPEIKEILGRALISEAPIEEDQERNTDLIVLRMAAVRIGCRVRRPKFYDNCRQEFTIRAGRPSGIKTELSKIIEGWGDYLFYGIADRAEAALASHHIVDLRHFRLWLMRELVDSHGIMPGLLRQNHDGSSKFMVFRYADLPVGAVLAHHDTGGANNATYDTGKADRQKEATIRQAR